MKVAKHKFIRVWAIIFSVVTALFFILTMVATQNKFLCNTINSVLGGERRYLKSGDPTEYQYYKTDYTSKEDTLRAADSLNDQICEEGMILLKNEGNALPLPKGAKVTVFGRNSVDVVLGGSGSNQGKVDNPVTDVNDSLSKAGFKCNPVIRNYYKGLNIKRPEVSMGTVLTGYPVCEAKLPYSDSVKNSYKDYNDAAVVVLSRFGGEGFDLPRTMFQKSNGDYKDWSADRNNKVGGAKNADDHYLELDQNESDMLKEACDNFDKVIVVINSASPMELGFLDDPENEDYNEKISAAIWAGHPGARGLNALGRILSGDVNPSGRTTDIFARNFKEDPTWFNFGNNLQENGNVYTVDGKPKKAYFVEYREGIYIGYRYYETQFAERNKDGGGEDWYNKNVIYPFGYGLSYTNFEWTVNPLSNPTIPISENSTIEIEVTVKNCGDRAGKDVVQLYYTSPYTQGGIEKPAVVLGDFIKTDILQPNEEKTYKLSISARDMASYDYDDKNHNGYKCYELEQGNYTVGIMKNSHDVFSAFEYKVDNDIIYKNSDVNTDYEIHNLFDDVSGHIENYLSRNNAFENFDVLKGSSDASYREVSKEFMATWTYSVNDKESDPWYTENMPVQGQKSKDGVMLYDLIGKSYDDPLWDELLNSLTIAEMEKLVSMGNYRTVAIESIGKPMTIDSDGPMGFASFMGDDSVYDTYYYASEALLGQTFNVDLAYKYGEMLGDESLVGNKAGDGRTYSGIYAPAMNTHRSPFSGRNFEYYSEDPLLSGKMAENMTLGASSKGLYTYAKHFALNDQETKRDETGLFTWANEQAMREVYFKPFEICVKEGKTTAIMSSFNRIGVTWAGGSYQLLTELLRKDWGFNGMVITDFNLKKYMDVDQMLRAGGSLNLSPEKGPQHTKTATDISVLRNATKDILYTVANSNAMNGSGKGVVWGMHLPLWIVWLIVANIILVLLTAGLYVLAFLLKRKYQLSVANKDGSIILNNGENDNGNISDKNNDENCE